MFMAPVGDGDYRVLGSGIEHAVFWVIGKRVVPSPQVPDHRGRVRTGGMVKYQVDRRALSRSWLQPTRLAPR
jgi:hypothetical protein